MKSFIKKNLLGISVFCIGIFIPIAIVIIDIPKQQIIHMLTTDKNADEHIWAQIHEFENNTISKKKVINSYKIDTNSVKWVTPEYYEEYDFKVYLNGDKDLYFMMDTILVGNSFGKQRGYDVKKIYSEKFRKMFEINRIEKEENQQKKEEEEAEKKELEEGTRLSKIARKEIVEDKKFDKLLWKYFKSPGIKYLHWDKNMKLKKSKISIKTFDYIEEFFRKGDDSNFYEFKVYFNGDKAHLSYWIKISRKHPYENYKIETEQS